MSNARTVTYDGRTYAHIPMGWNRVPADQLAALDAPNAPAIVKLKIARAYGLGNPLGSNRK